MSKFIDKLKQASTTSGQSMGFRAAAAKPKPRLMLVAQVATAGAAAGADAGLLVIDKLSSGVKALERASQAAPDIPWGGWLKEATGEGIGRLVAAGADFAVFPAGTPLFEEEKMGKILEVEPSLEPGLIKAIDELPIDAVLITGEGDNLLTWHQLMLCQRCASLLSKPLLVSVSPGVSSSELGALWEVGVMGVVVKATGRMAEIRQMLDKLPPPSAGKRRKAEPLLPRVGGETRITSEEEED